jgi:hypothetical protein
MAKQIKETQPVENGGTIESSGTVEAPVEKFKSYKDEAASLMKQLNVNAIYRTIDGQWFTYSEYANAHARKIGGEAEEYSLETLKQ